MNLDELRKAAHNRNIKRGQLRHREVERSEKEWGNINL